MSESLPLGRTLNGKELELNLVRNGPFQIVGRVQSEETANEIASIQVSLPHARAPSLFIAAFYVHVRTDPAKFTEQERAVGKGLGKLMLCALVKHLGLDPKTPVELQASGGSVPPGYDPSTQDMATVDAYLSKYPVVLSDIEHNVRVAMRRGSATGDEATIRNTLKAEAYITVLENQKLIQYYRGYGFEVVEDKGMYADMRSTVGNILEACRTAGGRRKTARRRRGKRTQRRKAKRFSSYST